MSKDPCSYAIQVDGEGGQERVVHLSGRIAIDVLPRFLSEMDALLAAASTSGVKLDLSGVHYLDSAGALLLLRYQDEAGQRSIPFRIDGISAEIQGVLDIVTQNRAAIPAPAGHFGDALERAHAGALRLADGFVQVMVFAGETVLALIQALRRPGSVRWVAVLFYMKRAGVDGLPIVGLISVLLGLIMAFMSSLQLRQFGANIYVASLVGIALVKELGPIMTAILFAGRSGSAFAAEIGTMMVNEEVDALKTMGFDPLRFLVIPKILAAVLVLPLLTLYADLLGITGGLLVGVAGLDLTFQAYFSQTMKTMKIFDILSSLVKSACFAVLISGIVCHRGFQVRGGAEAVGAAATSAVVSAIFLIIVADSAFAIMLHYIR